jgi:hypothetical protein
VFEEVSNGLPSWPGVPVLRILGIGSSPAILSLDMESESSQSAGWTMERFWLLEGGVRRDGASMSDSFGLVLRTRWSSVSKKMGLYTIKDK